MSKRYRVGIAGVVHGHVSAQIRDWKGVAQADIVAIADANEGERQGYLRRFELEGVREYDSIAQMLETEELDVVSVCTETSRHAEVVEAAAARRVHSIVEKPLAFSLADAERMYAAAGKYGVQVATNYPSRWPARILQRAVQFVKEGGIGRVYEVRRRGGSPKPRAIDANTFFQWLYQPPTNGAGAFMDYCCYGADLACDVLGQPTTVYAMAGRWARTDLVADDNARMLCTYQRGVAVIEATWTMFGQVPAGTHFAGETGTLALSGRDGAVLYDAEHPEGRPLTADDLPDPGLERSLPEHLLRCLEEGRPVVPWAGIEGQRNVTEVLDAGLRSIASGQPVHLPLPLPLMQG
ncbi:MAG TPA: Gfo/Idh/MocA family oxidoreductase [Chloroflexota bacterium]|nr:Gfo/Idh/MocA family oxidoreductase [Chloroflexota bacterium]